MRLVAIASRLSDRECALVDAGRLCLVARRSRAIAAAAPGGGRSSIGRLRSGLGGRLRRACKRAPRGFLQAGKAELEGELEEAGVRYRKAVLCGQSTAGPLRC